MLFAPLSQSTLQLLRLTYSVAVNGQTISERGYNNGMYLLQRLHGEKDCTI